MARREDLSKSTADNAQFIRDQLKSLSKALPPARRRSLSFKSVKNGAQLKCDATAYSRFLAGQRRLDDGDFYALVNYLFSQGILNERPDESKISSIEDFLFRSMMLYLNIGVETERNMASRASGTYKVWRPSTHRKGEYVIGMMEIAYNSNSAVVVTEKHVYKGGDGTIALDEVFSGYLFRKDKKYFILAKDVATRSVRVTFINGTHHGAHPITSMTGAVMGVHYENVYCAPTYIERYTGSRKDLESMLDIVEKDSVPRGVLNQLTDYQIIGDCVRF